MSRPVARIAREADDNEMREINTATILVSALVSALVALSVEWAAKPGLEAHARSGY